MVARRRRAVQRSEPPRGASESRTAAKPRLLAYVGRLSRGCTVMTESSIYERDLDRNPANYTPLTPLSLIARTAYDLARAARGRPRRAPLHLGGDLRALPRGSRRRWRSAGHRRRRHGRRDAAEHAGDDRSAFRRADDRRRAQHAQHAARRRGDRVHARARRGEGAGHRHRVRADGRRRRWRSSRAKPLVVDVDDALGSRAASALGDDRLRSVHRASGDPRIRVAAAGRRVGCDLAQLHVRHDRQSEGRRLPPPRRLSQRAVEHRRLGHAAARGLPVDAADVPLQRLVLPVDDGGERRHQRLPAHASRRRRSSTRSARTGSRTTAARRSCTRC